MGSFAARRVPDPLGIARDGRLHRHAPHVVTQWGLLDSLIRAVTGHDGPLFLVNEWIARGANIVAFIWKWMPFWTLVFIAGRMAIPQDIYDAADIDGAGGYRK